MRLGFCQRTCLFICLRIAAPSLPEPLWDSLFQSTCLIRRVSLSPSLSSHPLPPLNPLLFLVILNRVKSDRFSHSSPRSLRLLFSSQIQSFLCPSILQHSKHTNANAALSEEGAAPNTPRGRVHMRSLVLRKSPIGENLPQFLPHPVIPSQVKLTVCSVPASTVQSCCPFTVGASEEPIRLAVERKSEKVWHRYVDLPLFFPPFHVLSFTLFCTHTFRDTLPCEGQERGLPWETEAWVKEGCWQRKALTHLLAVTRLSPSL